jgi:hypothetical protein
MMHIVNKETEKETKQEKQEYIRIKKNVILLNVSDGTGCGFIRTIFPFIYINAVYGKDMTLCPIITPVFIKQPDILARSRSILFQRQMNPNHVDIIKHYKEMQKKYQYKIVYDFDDLLWGNNELQGGDIYHGIPSYNFAADRVSNEMKEAAKEIMKMSDLITTSTEYLKNYISSFVGDIQVEVIKNTVPIYLFGRKERKPEEYDIKKPIVLYNESPTHYSNKNKAKGDMNNAWCDWVIKSVKNNEIEFHAMGGLPFFFEEIKDKIKTYDWVNTLQYSYIMKMINPHFIISPLVSNEFNSAKSDIKKIESYAIGAIHIGSCFSDGRVSPYDDNFVKALDTIDVPGIDELIKKYCEKDLFNSTVQKGYQYLEINGRYTESAINVNKLISLF